METVGKFDLGIELNQIGDDLKRARSKLPYLNNEKAKQVCVK